LHLLLSDYNPRCQPPWTEKELRHKVNDAVRAPGETGTMLSASHNTNGVSRPPPELPTEKPKPVAHARRYSTIERKRVEWLVPDWLPLGKVVVLDGDPGLGKSTLLLDIAARVTTHGMHFNNKQGPVGTVVLLSAEDGPEDTIKPRLEAAGANPEMIIDLSDITVGDKQRPPEIPLDLDLIESVVREHKAKLLIIEPLAAFLAGSDANKDQEIRREEHRMTKTKRRGSFASRTRNIYRHQTERAGEPLRYTLAELRAVVTEALAAGTCPYCGWALNDFNFSVDHHNPISRDGDFSIGNILVCHLRCNKIKGNLTSHEFCTSAPSLPNSRQKSARMCSPASMRADDSCDVGSRQTVTLVAYRQFSNPLACADPDCTHARGYCGEEIAAGVHKPR
jgi:AAA domain/HNH endonuclease